MAFHTKYSPSQGDRFSKCQGALTLCAALPAYQQNVSGPAAKLGTCVHTLIETSLQQNNAPRYYEGRIVTIINDGQDDEVCKILPKSAKTPTNQFWVEIDEEIIDAAEMMTSHVRTRCKELGLDPTNRDELQLESRTNPIPSREDTSGTADVTLKAWPILLEVIDYKNGWNLVEHFGNIQLLAYLLGKALEANFEYRKYQITIVQPNAEHEEGKIRTFTATAAELRAFAVTYLGFVKACDVANSAPGAPTPKKIVKSVDDVNAKWADKFLRAAEEGEKNHCMFCDAKPVCRAYIAMRQRQASMEFDREPTDRKKPTSAADVAKILAWKPYFDALFKAAYLWGQRALENGETVEGQMLAEGRSNRKFIELAEDELVNRIVRRFPELKSKLFVKQLRTAPQLEKLLKPERRPKFEKEFMFKPRGALTMVPTSSGREEIHKHAGDDFDDSLDEMDFG